MRLEYPSLVVKTLNEILNVSNFLVVGHGLLFPSSQSLVVLSSEFLNSLDLTLNNWGPDVSVELSNLLLLLKGETLRILGNVVHQLSQFTLWVFRLSLYKLWDGCKPWIVFEINVVVQLDIWTIFLILNIVKAKLIGESWTHGSDFNSWQSTLCFDQPMAWVW